MGTAVDCRHLESFPGRNRVFMLVVSSSLLQEEQNKDKGATRVMKQMALDCSKKDVVKKPGVSL